MADEGMEYGMAPEGEDNSAHDDDLSPGFDSDTRDDSGSDDNTGTDEVATLRAELEEMKKRVANGSRTTQELRQAQQALQQYESRLKRWKSSGVDPDEIDRILESSGQSPANANTQPKSDSLTKAELDTYLMQRDMLRDWNYEKKLFFKENAGLDNKYFRRHMDSIAAELANEEIIEYGRIVSTPEEVAAKAGKEVKLMIEQAKLAGEKQATTRREKVKGQGIVESGHARSKPSGEPDKEMTEEEYLTYSRNLQLGKLREHQKQFMQRK